MPVRQRARQQRAASDPAVAARIRALRQAQGLTQAQLAGEEFTKGFISQLETGFSRLSVHAAQVLAGRLGVSVSDLLGEAKPSSQQAELEILRAERELAAGSPAEALRLADGIEGSGRSHGRVLRLRGRALLGLDRARDALGVLEEARKALRAREQLDLVARTQFDLAYAHARLDEHEEALLAGIECLRAFAAGDIVDRTLELQLHAVLGSLYTRRGNAVAADSHIKRALEIAEDISDREALAAVHASIARTEEERGNLERAIEQWRRSLAFLEELGREHAVAETWHNLAVTYIARGAEPNARAALSRSEELAHDLNHRRLMPWITLARAKMSLAEGRAVEAEKSALAVAHADGTTPRCRAEAMFVAAQAARRHGASTARLHAAFDAALQAAAAQPAAAQARVLREYADALAESGDVAGGYAQLTRALDLLAVLPPAAGKPQKAAAPAKVS